MTGASVGRSIGRHTDRVQSIAFSPDGTHVVSGSKDRTLRLWHLSSYYRFGLWRRVYSLFEVAVIHIDFFPNQTEFSACGSYLISQDELWDIRSLPPSPVTGINPAVSPQSSSPVRYNDTSRMIEVHTSSVRTFPVSGCQVHVWKAQGGHIALGMDDGRVVIIDCTHLL